MPAQNSTFEKITIEQGLSQGMIFDILQTRDGFLWVATKDGLNRYDGYNFKVFANDPFDAYSLAQNSVNTLFEDSRGLLWIGLDSKGLDVLDRRTGRFHHFSLDYKDGLIIHGTEVRRITELPDGSICVLKIGVGLIRIAVPDSWKNGLPAEPLLEKLSKPALIPVATDVKAISSPEAIMDMALLQNGQLLATSNHRQYQINPTDNSYQIVNSGLVPFGSHWMALGDEAFDGDLWAGQGTEIRRLRGGQIKSYIPSGMFCALTLNSGKKGHIWLSLCGSLWDLEPGENLDISKPDITVDAVITSIEQDRNGNLWLGTAGYGLRKINVLSKLFHSGGRGLSPSGLWRSPSGRYFGKQVTIIKEYFPTTGQFAPASAFSKTPLDQLGLAFEPDGAIWLLCKETNASVEGMLKRFTPEGQLLKTFTFEGRMSNFDILFRLRSGRLVVGAGDCRLVYFDPVNEQFTHSSFAHLFGEKSSSVHIVSLAEEADGILWIGTQMGLIRYKQGNAFPSDPGDFQLFEAHPANPAGLNNNSIASILPAQNGEVWLGTKGGGINILNAQTGKCRHITNADGLLDKVVYAILPGNRPGEYWCSTNRGLAKITVLKNDPFTFETTTFTSASGLQDNEFNTNAYLKTDDGELLFGGINGLNRFFPEELHADTTAPPVFVVNIEVNHQKTDIICPENSCTLDLSHSQNNVSFEFAALDFTDPSKNRYRYRLVGLDAGWVETGNHRFAHFSHLAPGSYEMRVQGSNGESAWRDAPPVTVIIRPPWHRSNLAYLCYILLLAWAGWRAYQFQIQRVKEREQLAFEQRETERVRALEQVKTNFFTNVAHEFRTPLTLIIEPLRQFLKNPKDLQNIEKIRLAERNSRQLLSLVNQLLDMAKLESGQMSLDLRQGNLMVTLREVFEQFLPLAEKRQIKLSLRQDFQDLQDLEFDPGKVELILKNLIFNALKFTPKGGRVGITVSNPVSGEHAEVLSGQGPMVPISVRDSGIGIPPEALDKIFDRFYQVDASHTRAGEGTGIGLALSKELTELMGGKLLVESEMGKGSTFTFYLPLKVGKDSDQRASSPLAEKTEAPAIVEKRPNPPSAAGQAVVLIIEDNTDLRLFIKDAIGPDWLVVEASDGEEGIKKAYEFVPDLIISDVMMPRKDGFAVITELKHNELSAHIPIILLTAKSDIESRLAGLRRGADDYLAKPFSTEELLVRMENVVEMRRRLWRLFSAQTGTQGASGAAALPGASELLSDPDRAFLHKFASLIENNLSNEAISIEDFAQKLRLSRSQLHRKLAALTGQSTSEFVRNYRLDQAYVMLKNRKGRVAEIAIRTGFGNEKYFSTVFKEKFGVSPSQV